MCMPLTLALQIVEYSYGNADVNIRVTNWDEYFSGFDLMYYKNLVYYISYLTETWWFSTITSVLCG